MRHGRLGTALFLLALVHCKSPAAEEIETLKIDIPNALMVSDDILAGGQPDADQFRQAAAAGFRTIINLRGPGEEGSLANEVELIRSLNMDYIAIPISGESGLNEESARKLADSLAESEALPAMVHCASGNRVGILLALKAFAVDGLDGEEALAYGTAMGMRRVPERLTELLGSRTED